MSGHSHWSTIKHRKEAQDKKKGAAFSRAARLISLAAREGGSDPSTNFELRSAIDKARAVNMPNKSIERAIERGAGGSGQEEWYRFGYEAFGPGQTALIIEGITNNKNRTLDEVRQILGRHGAKIADPGSVKWLFQYWGKLLLPKEQDSPEEMELKAIEAGAVETEWSEEGLTVHVQPDSLEKSKGLLEGQGLKIAESSLEWAAKEEVSPEESDSRKLESLLEALSDHDDVQEVYLNASL